MARGIPRHHATADQPSANMKNFHCLRCGAVLGITNGIKLFAGGIFLDEATRLGCTECGKHRRWVPLDSLPTTYSSVDV